MEKYTSRKFILCAAAFLGSLGTSIAAISSDNPKVATIGLVCSMFSAAIYAAAEAYVDGRAVEYDPFEDMESEFLIDDEDLPEDEDEEEDEEEEEPEYID